MTMTQAQPSRALLVFALGILLLGLLEGDRLSAFLERLPLPGVERFAQTVREAASLSGAGLISNSENRLLTTITPTLRVGNRAANETLEFIASVPLTDVPAPLSPDPGLPVPVVPAPVAPPTVPSLTEHNDVPTTREDKPRVLIVGDSLIMEGLGPALLRSLRKNEHLDVSREGKYSTGLTRTDTFNWPTHLRELVAERRPDLVMVSLGANDFQDILVDGKRHIAGSESWQLLYRQRADQFLSAATSTGARVLWLGLPIMGNETYEKRIRGLSALQQQACEAVAPLCLFKNNEAALADQTGAYLSHITDAQGRHVRLRYKDKIHVTEAGGQLITNEALPMVTDLLAPEVAAYLTGLELKTK